MECMSCCSFSVLKKARKKASDSDAFSTCDRRFELPTFWSVARRSIQLS